VLQLQAARAAAAHRGRGDARLDTLGNAYFTKVDVLDPDGWRRVALVTSDTHAERAAWIFRKLLGPGY
jgi:uncharacterized SAM-binding protein YcdF (DUF218 family)